MNIQWWMLDGGICLIILISMILGAAKGIGDTILRLIGMAGGMVLAVLYSDVLKVFLADGVVGHKLRVNILQIVKGNEETRDVASESVMNSLGQGGADPYQENLPKTISSVTTGIRDAATSAAADRLTDLALNVIAFVLIVLAVWLLVAIVRAIMKHFRNNSIVLGFTDRLLGATLGLVKGIIVACLAAAIIVPLVTAFAPDYLTNLMEAMEETKIAGIIYDMNPLMYAIKMVIG